VMLLLATAIGGWCGIARAQTATTSAGLETEIPGVSAFTRPPANFNPMTATDAELDRYGFPPRPSRELGADLLARWERRVMSQTRIVPQLRQTNTFHTPARSIKQIKATGGTVEAKTTRKSVSLAMTPPHGTELVGNSIEWILERPTINNAALSKLTNYLLNPWTDIGGVTLPRRPGVPVAYLPTGAPASATIYRLWMSDGAHQLSGVQLFSVDGAMTNAAPSLWFFATTPY